MRIKLLLVLAVLVFICTCLLSACTRNVANSIQPIPTSTDSSSSDHTPLIVGISPYQDIGMIVNEKNLGLEKKYGTKLDLVTMAWDDILPAVASAGRTVDVGFGSLIEYLSKIKNLNNKTDDPVLFVYPIFVFKGGGFITFNPAVPDLTPQNIDDSQLVKKFLSFRFGIQKNNVSEMVLFSLARRAGVLPSQLHTVDNTINDSLLATEQGSLDCSYGGGTQRTEAWKRHGRVALMMDTVGVVDIDGFICKESTFKTRRKDIENLIKMWFDCTNYVMTDLDHHSAQTLAYLKANASTQYTLAEFKRALTQEYFPTSISETEREIVSPTGKYSIDRVTDLLGKYLVDVGAVKIPPGTPTLLHLQQ